MPSIQSLVDGLSAVGPEARLDSLRALMGKIESGEIAKPRTGDDVNNHIHTTFSFSPYSPSKALYLAYASGLGTAGIVDHDTISGAGEFIEAGRIIGMATTIGIECRVDMSLTPLKGRRINNTDQNSIAYIVLHGVPHTMIDSVTSFFKPYIEARNVRNRKMTEKINILFSSFGIELDFDRDVVSLSEYTNGGSITERHISLALSRKMIGRFGRGRALVTFLKEGLQLRLDEKSEKLLCDGESPYYEYDLLGFIKSEFIASFYIDAALECPPVRDVLALSQRIGSVSAYAYLGDVSDSVTGDKRAQKFEDDYIEELFEVISALGFNAVTYMPSRNTAVQLSRVRGLCERFGLFQISGVDINSPRQSFVCAEMQAPEFENLKESTWALIGHEIEATGNIQHGMFSGQTVHAYPDLNERIALFREIGKRRIKGETRI